MLKLFKSLQYPGPITITKLIAVNVIRLSVNYAVYDNYM